MRGVRALAAVIAVVLSFGSATAYAATTTYAPLDQPGPPLSVPMADLTASLKCEASVRNATVTPVLLNPATGVTADENYSWNWEPALTKLGIPWCAYTAPHDTLGDIPTSGEYLVYAIRTMYAMAGRRIDIMGHSQGGMSMRWPLRFWPDTRAMVDDVIGFSGSNHGTTVGTASSCESEGCTPASWQQVSTSNFTQAINSDAETFPGISYTEIWTHTDEVVQPNGTADVASAALHTGGGTITDVPTQQLCPGDVDEHLTIGTIDPVAYALAVDALTHPGPANVARTQAANPGLCSQLYMPGVNPANLQNELQVLQGAPGLVAVDAGPLGEPVASVPSLHTEPTLPCYVYAVCTGSAAPSLIMKLPFKHIARGAKTVLHVQVNVQEGTAMVGVPGVRVTVDGKSAVTNAHGAARVTAPLSRGHRYQVSSVLVGANTAAQLIGVS